MSIKVPEVESCCGFISLRTGAKLFGFLSLIGCLILCALSVWYAVVLIKHVPGETGELINLSIDIVAKLTQMAASVFLLLGVYQENAKFIPPWLIVTVICTILEVLILPSAKDWIMHVSYLEIEWVIVTIFMLFDDIYGWLVVYSYYRTLTPRSGNVV